jgi:hypothetical protein
MASVGELTRKSVLPRFKLRLLHLVDRSSITIVKSPAQNKVFL